MKTKTKKSNRNRPEVNANGIAQARDILREVLDLSADAPVNPRTVLLVFENMDRDDDGLPAVDQDGYIEDLSVIRGALGELFGPAAANDAEKLMKTFDELPPLDMETCVEQLRISQGAVKELFGADAANDHELVLAYMTSIFENDAE